MDQPNTIDEQQLTFWQQHKFLLLIAITIIISLVLVVISMIIYYSSGAAQLDLSRPGYKSVSDQVIDGSSSIADYSAYGPINSSSIEEFKELYDAQAESATAVDAFGGDPLNPDVLEFGQTKQ